MYLQLVCGRSALLDVPLTSLETGFLEVAPQLLLSEPEIGAYHRIILVIMLSLHDFLRS